MGQLGSTKQLLHANDIPPDYPLCQHRSPASGLFYYGRTARPTVRFTHQRSAMYPIYYHLIICPDGAPLTERAQLTEQLLDV